MWYHQPGDRIGVCFSWLLLENLFFFLLSIKTTDLWITAYQTVPQGTILQWYRWRCYGHHQPSDPSLIFFHATITSVAILSEFNIHVDIHSTSWPSLTSYFQHLLFPLHFNNPIVRLCFRTFH